MTEKQKNAEQIAGEILRLPEGRLDPKTPLVRAGFDSLMLMELAQRTRRRLGRSLAPALFLETKDLADLADHIAVAPADRTKEAVIVPAPQDRFKPFPLTDVQHAYWLGRGEEMPLGGVSCCAYAELDFRNPDLTRLEKALNKTIARHDMLRCVFTDDGRTQRTEVDLTEALADFNGDMTTAYRVTGTLETPVGMEEGKGEITGWETVEGGDASAEM